VSQSDLSTNLAAFDLNKTSQGDQEAHREALKKAFQPVTAASVALTEALEVGSPADKISKLNKIKNIVLSESLLIFILIYLKSFITENLLNILQVILPVGTLKKRT